jgi:hypothetical protein
MRQGTSRRHAGHFQGGLGRFGIGQSRIGRRLVEARGLRINEDTSRTGGAREL